MRSCTVSKQQHSVSKTHVRKNLFKSLTICEQHDGYENHHEVAHSIKTKQIFCIA